MLAERTEGVGGSHDAAVVEWQLGRSPRPMSGVAARCPYGLPAVVEMLPVDEQGRPFPTLYYLTCPTAVAAVGRLENAGGVRRFQRVVDGDDGLRASLAAAVHDTRARRAELTGDSRRAREARAGLDEASGSGECSGAEGAACGGAGSGAAEGAGFGGAVPGAASAAAVAAALATGVGGVADPARLKCLHAHAAHALARPGYVLGAAILAEAGELWCTDRRCAASFDEAPSDGAETPGVAAVTP